MTKIEPRNADNSRTLSVVRRRRGIGPSIWFWVLVLVLASALAAFAAYVNRRLERPAIGSLEPGTVVLLGGRGETSSRHPNLGSGLLSGGYYRISGNDEAGFVRSPFWWPPDFLDVPSFSLSPDGHIAVPWSSRSWLDFIDTDTGLVIQKYVGSDDSRVFVGSLWSPDGAMIAVGIAPAAVGEQDPYSVLVFEVSCLMTQETCEPRWTIPNSCVSPCSGVSSVGASWLPTGDGLVLWDVLTKQLVRVDLVRGSRTSLPHQSQECTAASYAPGMDWLAIVCERSLYLLRTADRLTTKVIDSTGMSWGVKILGWSLEGKDVFFIAPLKVAAPATWQGSADSDATEAALFSYNVQTNEIRRLTFSEHEQLSQGWVITK